MKYAPMEDILKPIFIFFWVGSGDYTWKDVNVSNFIPFCPITSLFVPLHPSSDITQPLYFGEKYSLKSSFYLQSFSIPYNLYKLLLCGILLMQFLKAFVGWTSQRTVLLFFSLACICQLFFGLHLHGFGLIVLFL